jgi:hypothetical protein
LGTWDFKEHRSDSDHQRSISFCAPPPIFGWFIDIPRHPGISPELVVLVVLVIDGSHNTDENHSGRKGTDPEIRYELPGIPTEDKSVNSLDLVRDFGHFYPLNPNFPNKSHNYSFDLLVTINKRIMVYSMDTPGKWVNFPVVVLQYCQELWML